MFGIKKDLKIHFIGIGGIGMSGIAEVLVNLGYNVSGSDLNENANVVNLKNKNVEIYKGHREENIIDVQIVVYSSAINYENPEIKKALELKIPIIKRAEMLAELMRLKYGIAIAGSHGKTTTTSFISTIFKNLDQKPTCIVGGVVKNLGGQAVRGDSDYLIAEADESDGSFLFLNPIMSVITNIDNDHLDYYKTEENIKKAFVEFSNKAPFYGCIAINGNDKNSAELIASLRRPYITYGLESKESFVDSLEYVAKNVEHTEEFSKFDLVFEDKNYPVQITLSGDHNVQNALAAIAISAKVGLDLKDVCKAIEDFEGVGRRFECLYKSKTMIVIDDYGHHPTELKATISTAKAKYPDRKLITVFEPHRFSRTKEHWSEFIECFEAVDEVYIAPIYAASEQPIEYIDAEILVKNINDRFKNAYYIENWDELTDIFNKNKDEKSVVLSMGAGSISKTTRTKIEEWKS
jgi:UDP-N-acetylmuramate--alanine ligase